MRVGDERIAIAVASQQAVLNLGGRPELADQEQAADQKHQDDHDPRQTRGLPFSRLLGRTIIRPMAWTGTLHSPIGMLPRAIKERHVTS